MITPWYIAVEPFSPDCGDRWTKYVEWSGLAQLEEVVSLDGVLCPRVVRELVDEDWKHNVHEDFLVGFFQDLEYLLARVAHEDRCSILAAVRNPLEECRGAWADARFTFHGYDLVDANGCETSALTNCGGFPLAFRGDELSCVGLVPELSRARAIQAALLEHYPGEHHARCDVWALWRWADKPPV